MIIINMLAGKVMRWLLVVLLSVEIYGITKTSPVRMCDDPSCDIQVSLTDATFYFLIYNSHLSTTKYFVTCFRKRTVTLSNLDNACSLDGLFNRYVCFDLVPSGFVGNDYTGITITRWTADSTLSSPNKTDSSTSPWQLSYTIGTAQTKINVDFQIDANTIYELYMGYVVNLQTDSRTKTGFFSTFQYDIQSGSDNLIMQRHVKCFQYYYLKYINVNLLFYGGTVRGGNNTMFFSVLSYLQDETGNFASIDLNAWIGISLAQSHAGRDMMAFLTKGTTALDLYSLYYSAPYLDDSSNVLGSNDIMLYADSFSYLSNNVQFFYWGTAVRKYDTGDIMGDEIIMKKMNSSFCFAVAYSSSKVQFYDNFTANKHNYFNCFTPNIELWESYSVVSIAISLIMLHLLSF